MENPEQLSFIKSYYDKQGDKWGGSRSAVGMLQGYSMFKRLSRSLLLASIFSDRSQ